MDVASRGFADARWQPMGAMLVRVATSFRALARLEVMPSGRCEDVHPGDRRLQEDRHILGRGRSSIPLHLVDLLVGEACIINGTGIERTGHQGSQHDHHQERQHE